MFLVEVLDRLEIQTTIKKFKEYNGKRFNARSDKSAIAHLSFLFNVSYAEIKKYMSQKRLKLVHIEFIPVKPPAGLYGDI